MMEFPSERSRRAKGGLTAVLESRRIECNGFPSPCSVYRIPLSFFLSCFPLFRTSAFATTTTLKVGARTGRKAYLEAIHESDDPVERGRGGLDLVCCS
jgi:hypothetical protein